MYHKKQVIADSKIHCISKNGSCLATYDGNYINIYRLWNGFYELCRKLNLEEVASIALDNNFGVLFMCLLKAKNSGAFKIS